MQPTISCSEKTNVTNLPTVGPRFLISDLCAFLETYLDPKLIKVVYHAYLFGAEAHEGQHRRSGEPYIYHPIAVAKILAEMKMDCNSLVAAILHDVIEDTNISKDDLKALFGEEVANLVDGVSKLTHLNTKNKAEAQAENFQKMLLAMANDIRVIIIKLSDRLHNMRTLGAMPLEKRRRIARETLEIYAPIANRLGMNHIRVDLEDLGFANLYPMRYQVITNELNKIRGSRKEIIKKIELSIGRRLRQENLSAKVIGREKHIFSIYKKMKNKKLNFNEILDVYAFRIIVDTPDTCYRTLGVIHDVYRPVPGRFKDYIAIPKTNGYQSLHSVLIGPHGVHVEVQIRSEEMNNIAESGIAAHWLYKTGDLSENKQQVNANEWLRNLLAMQEKSGSPIEFIENVKVDLFPDEVYVFTPTGEIMVLAKGSTVIDFAYAIHSDVGNACVSARIDRRMTPQSTILLNGQTVEIITKAGAHPNPSWLNFVVTIKARTSIRSYLKSCKENESIKLGKRLLEQALTAYSTDLSSIPYDVVTALLDELSLKKVESLLSEIGLGNHSAPLIARRLVPVTVDGNSDTLQPKAAHVPLLIQGTEGMVINMAKCCRPIPGDPIFGFFSAGKGIVIHHQSCKNIAIYKKRPDSWVEIQWDESDQSEYTTEIYIEVSNQRGVLALVAFAISEMNSNIDNVHVEDRDGLSSTIIFTLSVKNRIHLARIMKRIRLIKTVMKIYRAKG